MYWYRSGAVFAIVIVSGMILVTCWSACKPDARETGAALKYFDVKDYFTKDTARLNKLNKPVLKTVTHNSLTESKKVRIDNWGLELDLFIASDINRPAWKNSYTVVANDSVLLYKAKDTLLKTQEMMIKMDKQKVKWIFIYNHTKNILYETSEWLSYFPDSLYLIRKVQKVRLMGINSYRIQGVIKN